jgi:hypothetical protein
MESSCEPSTDNSNEVNDPLTPQYVDGVEILNFPLTCVRRRYRMAYIPSGFWSRLISRLIINLKRSGLEEASSVGGPPVIYWKRGIVVIHSSGRFLVESIQGSSTGEKGMFGVRGALRGGRSFIGRKAVWGHFERGRDYLGEKGVQGRFERGRGYLGEKGVQGRFERGEELYR